jgi:4-aminobutyrate aminotransferase-like enzyme
MAVGREVLRVIDDEKLQENAHKMGMLFQKGLNEIKSRVHTVGDVRGKGLMIGVEIVQD